MAEDIWEFDAPKNPFRPEVVLEVCTCGKCGKSGVPVGRLIGDPESPPLEVSFSRPSARVMAKGLWEAGMINKPNYLFLLRQISRSEMADRLLERDEKKREENLSDFCEKG
ncbi:MAG: hypothetical protein WCV68_01205 [Candidatus Paceibacterota bacterium]|jgi:hypothetical protein